MNFNNYLLENKLDLVLAVSFSFLSSIPFMGIIYYLGVIVDSLHQSVQQGSFDHRLIISQVATFMGIILAGYILEIVYQLFSTRFNSKTSRNIRSDVFQALLGKSQKYFDEENTGDIIAKSTNDLSSINNYFYVLTAQGGLTIGLFLFIIGPLFYIHHLLGLIAISGIPVLIISLKFFERQYNPIELSSKEKYGELSATIAENLDNAILTKIFNSMEYNISKLQTIMRDLKLINILKGKREALLNIQDKIIVTVMYSLILIIGGRMVILEQISIGELITSLFLVQYLVYPVMLLIQLIVFRSSYHAAESRLATLLAHPPHVQNPEQAKVLDQVQGSIQFQNVSFGYQDLILENINLHIDSNTTTALLGASGSGKSALINLIPRFYDVITGSLLIDGTNVKELDLPSLRRSIGFVDQETFLFSKTIRENIAFGRPEADLSEVIKVAEMAQIHDYIESLPDGYETKIGGRGMTLSGGQRQRLSIARALLLDPKIIIFDDSLSAVDIKTEHKIQSVLENLLENRTVIFITQRLSTILNSDQLVIMGDGGIIESGTHQKLLEMNGVYSDLYASQVDGMMDLKRIGDGIT